MLDCLIVGHGLAGSVLAFTLISRGYRVMVYDQPASNHTSQVAAGLYNPVTGRKMSKTWMADALFPFLENFYTRMEVQTGASFLHSLPIYRPFTSIEEQNDWMGVSGNNQYASFVEKVAGESLYGQYVHDPYGGLLLRQSGYVDIPVLLQSMRRFLQERNSYQETAFHHNQLQVEAQQVQYGQHIARNIVFCDGPAGQQNPYFSWLPFSPVKGELLYVQTSEPLELVYNRGVFVLPTEKYCKVGATYQHHDLGLQITTAAREQLSEKLNILLKTQYTIMDQVAGIRPATRDRRPFAGRHPVYKPLAVFNGLGTKGVSLAPYFASQLTSFLMQDVPLIPEVNISRYFKLYNSAIA